MRILFIGAHTDDIELSCGGTVARMIEKNNEVMCLVFSDCGQKELILECESAIKKLGVDKLTISEFDVRSFDISRQPILDILIRIRELFAPDLIITHSENDRHQDHSVIGQESLRAFRNYSMLSYTSAINRILGHENYFYELDPKHIDLKLRALKCYETQKERSYMEQKVVVACARVMGLKAGCEFAEGFEVIKLIQ